MKYEEYQTLKKDSIFNSKAAFVCEACFLELTRYCNFSGSNTENVLRTIRPSIGKNVQSRYFQKYKEAQMENNPPNSHRDKYRSSSVDPKVLSINNKKI